MTSIGVPLHQRGIIMAGGTLAPLAAKRATSTIPIGKRVIDLALECAGG